MRDDEDERSEDDDEDRSSLSDLAGRISGEPDAQDGRGRSRTDASRDDADDSPDRIRDEDAEDAEDGVGPHIDGESREGDEPTLSDLAESIKTKQGAESAAESDDMDEWGLVGHDGPGGDAGVLDPKTEAVLELAGDTPNVLLSGPSGCSADQSLCSKLMAFRSTEPVNLLVITVSETPSQRLSILQNYLGSPVNETAVVDVRNYNRAVNYDEYDGPVEIRTVSSPQDLRRIGIVTSKLLTGWADSPGQTRVCFHSLSDLLTLNDDRERLFRFLHVLRGRIQSADARAHYHFDPTKHDEEAVRTFESLFETIITFEEDGSVSLP